MVNKEKKFLEILPSPRWHNYRRNASVWLGARVWAEGNRGGPEQTIYPPAQFRHIRLLNFIMVRNWKNKSVKRFSHEVRVWDMNKCVSRAAWCEYSQKMHICSTYFWVDDQRSSRTPRAWALVFISWQVKNVNALLRCIYWFRPRMVSSECDYRQRINRVFVVSSQVCTYVE